MLLKRLRFAQTEVANGDRPFQPMFKADWLEAVFIHFAVAPEALQSYVPFELDTFHGAAYLSLVAFTQRRLRPAIGGRIAEVLSTPLACHPFLNLRTYVRNGDERGIYFLAEWIPNRLAALIGPLLYGLPYRVGRLDYVHDALSQTFRGTVNGRGRRIEFSGAAEQETFVPCDASTLDAFLVERYTAWTFRDGVARRFRIRHAPWQASRARVKLHRADLIEGQCGRIFEDAVPCLAHVSEGTLDVEISAPEKCNVCRRGRIP